jgi:hypothetical protein
VGWFSDGEPVVVSIEPDRGVGSPVMNDTSEEQDVPTPSIECHWFLQLLVNIVNRTERACS